MSHPDPCYDPDNSYEDDDMNVEHDPSDALLAEYLYDDHNDFYGDSVDYDDRDDYEGNSGEMDWDDSYDDSMDGDFDSAMRDAGFGTDEDYGCYGEDF